MDEKDLMQCTHDCGTCAAACGTENGEKKGKSFFDTLESISESFDDVGEDELINMLNNIVSELEKDDEEPAGGEA